MVNSGQQQHPYAQSANPTPFNQPNHHSLYYASNGNATHLHAVSTGSISGSESTLVSIDSADLVTSTTSNNLHPMGSQTAGAAVAGNNNKTNQRANLFRRFPLRSILKNGKVHNSSSDESCFVLPQTGQPRSGILKKAPTEANGVIPNTVLSNNNSNSTNGNLQNTSSSSPPNPSLALPSSFPPPPILQVSPSSASSHASAKSAASLVHFTQQPERKDISVSNPILFYFLVLNVCFRDCGFVFSIELFILLLHVCVCTLISICTIFRSSYRFVAA